MYTNTLSLNLSLLQNERENERSMDEEKRNAYVIEKLSLRS